MREILFKAKRIDDGEWVEGSLIFSKDAEEGWEAVIIPTTDSYMFVKEYEGDLGFEKWHAVDKDTICQYTGLSDKNGNKIWENDIMKYEWDGKTRIEVIKYQAPIFTYDKSFRWSLHKDEVIGNVFDNPELLERN